MGTTGAALGGGWKRRRAEGCRVWAILLCLQARRGKGDGGDATVTCGVCTVQWCLSGLSHPLLTPIQVTSHILMASLASCVHL